MIYTIFVVTFLLVVTKLMDVLSTIQRITNASQETNPSARTLMNTFGTKRTIWLVFTISLITIAISCLSVISLGLYTQIAFIVLGCFITIVQACVADSNWQGRDNFITKYVRIIHLRVARFFWQS